MRDIITYQEFEKYMQSIRTIFDIEDRLADISHEVKQRSKSEFNLYYPSLVAETMELLAKVVDDKDDWINYFVFELDFGSKNNVMQVKDGDGNIIPLATVEDLWNILHV